MHTLTQFRPVIIESKLLYLATPEQKRELRNKGISIPLALTREEAERLLNGGAE